MRIRCSINFRHQHDHHCYLEDSARGRAEDYFIKPGYKHREKVEYCSRRRRGATGRQAEVYRAAALLAEETGARAVLDLGCGGGEKTVARMGHLEVVGVDYGENLERCRQRYPEHTWHAVDLGAAHTVPRPKAAEFIVVCADVLEHLPHPEHLLATLRDLARDARAVVISTPERDLERGCSHMGPPPNTKHAREWNLHELQRLLAHWELPATVSLVRSGPRAERPQTMVAVTRPLAVEARRAA